MRMDPIEYGEFLRRTGAKLPECRAQRIEKVVSLRNIRDITMVISMTDMYLAALLRNIGLLGDPECKPYRNASFSSLRVDPNGLLLGQKFVYRPTYIAIIENFKDIFKDFLMSKGISSLTPLIVLGEDEDGQIAIAHYICPIFEVHDGSMVILDGVHRDYIIKSTGGSIEGIVINNIDAPFPCTPHPWDDISVVDDKPSKVADRYFDLDQGRFRDLKSSGIDG